MKEKNEFSVYLKSFNNQSVWNEMFYYIVCTMIYSEEKINK